MNTLYQNIQSLCAARGISGSRMCAELGLSKSLMSDLKSGRRQRISSETARKIAVYFAVPLERVLLGEMENHPSGRRAPTSEEIKFALFGGEGEITDAMYDEVRQFAAFVKAREAGEKKE